MKLKGNYIIVCFYLLLFTCTEMRISFSQITASRNLPDIDEKILLHTDRNFYIAGERIWFRIYLTDINDISDAGFSRVAYVELLNNSNEVILKQKVKTEPSGGSGYMDIPGDFPSGYYFLRSYTNWMKNFNPEDYFISVLAIVNPGSKINNNEIASELIDSAGWNNLTNEIRNDNYLPGKREENLDIKVHNVNMEYMRRQKVDLEISTAGASGNPVAADISVSVFYTGDKEFYPPVIQNCFNSDSVKNPELVIDAANYRESLFIPELEGVTISGKIIESATQNPVPGVPVILSVIGANSFLKSCLTRADGKFCFSLDDLYEEKNVVISYNYSSDNLQVVIDEPFSQDFAKLPDLQLRLDESWRSFIEKQMINYQLTSIYSEGQKSLHPDSTPVMEPFYVQPDFTVRMEEFIRLPNMEEVFRELVKQVLVTKENGRLTLNVLDFNTNRIIGPVPLLLLDGMPFFDPGLIFELNPEDIEVINIVSHKYYKGVLVMDGIIDIRTNQGNLPVSDLPGNTDLQLFQGYQEKQEFKGPDYSDESKLKSRIPDFRNLLFWAPSIKTDNEGKAQISFCTSDNTGRYKINIQGKSLNGFSGSVSYSFKVIK